MERERWIRERRRVGEERMDRLFAPSYDDDWGGYINSTHREQVARFLSLCPPRARLLDAACGTGKYWPLLQDAGASVIGMDQSAGMLRRATEKFTDVPVRKLGMQELDDVGAFDGILCIDALELVAPEDWPLILGRFNRALVPAGLLYLTVELPEPDLPEVFAAAQAAGLPVVAGEYVKDGGYHYYPAVEQVRAWLDAGGFGILEETVGDGYHHFLARKSERAPAPAPI